MAGIGSVVALVGIGIVVDLLSGVEVEVIVGVGLTRGGCVG
jgi:hypothetical protein